MRLLLLGGCLHGRWLWHEWGHAKIRVPRAEETEMDCGNYHMFWDRHHKFQIIFKERNKQTNKQIQTEIDGGNHHMFRERRNK